MKATAVRNKALRMSFLIANHLIATR